MRFETKVGGLVHATAGNHPKPHPARHQDFGQVERYSRNRICDAERQDVARQESPQHPQFRYKPPTLCTGFDEMHFLPVGNGVEMGSAAGT
jgi:hypothetical protein